MKIKLNEVEKVYLSKIKKMIDNESSLNPCNIIELSKNLYKNISVEEVSTVENPDFDMLLFQYGIYDWGDEHGEHFCVDITRQFITGDDYEPYQLNFTLIYTPEQFRMLSSYSCWSYEFNNMEDFVNHITSTDGFELACKVIPKTYELVFSQC